MILLIDNYDSFTYNIVQYLGMLGEDVKVYRNDKISIEEIEKIKPEAIVISPGPCTPNEAGISLEVVKQLKGKYPIFGVCLGHQTIGQAFGAEIIRASRIMHGKISKINHLDKGVFNGLKNPIEATRYHSLIIKNGTLPDEVEVTAWTKEDEIMAIKHKKYLIEGVQFHPESILTEDGLKMLENFMKEVRK
ncbi:anthranilate synthase component II [Haliovirga abyssi]|uniref:Glutamine amidotransferase n=1 Tax=Haliovirga abyssi TaxID=2996794 RepID=A0AAU9DHQ6_9FUSO|nr:aminodeoxychorismate/anthranilate synthase component II [Haliovirga abyssi]BDU50279.1 glutamine amidotransferase [Haliovirga abyssi]